MKMTFAGYGGRLASRARWLTFWTAVALAAATVFGATWDVAIQNFAFTPKDLTIQAGDTVRWTQKDAISHTTTSGPNGVADGIWDSGSMTLAANTEFSFTFTNAGTFPYFCRPHKSNMRGTINVQSPAAAALGVPEPAGVWGVKLTWSAGTPPFLIQTKTDLNEAAWTDVVTTSGNSTTVARPGEAGYYRVVSSADKTVTAFTALLSGASERPNPVASAASGFGVFSLSGNTLTVHLHYSGLSGSATGAHIHGIADTTQSAGVLLPLNVAAAEAGTITGVYDASALTAEQRDGLLHGRAYVNIHTSAHPAGEIRGQVAPVLWNTSLSGTAERPTPVETSASGYGAFWFVGNELTYDVDYDGLSATATMAHLHGPADVESSAPVLQGLEVEGVLGLSGAFSGRLSLTPAQMDALLTGLTYVNVHSGNHAAGELRGQLLP